MGSDLNITKELQEYILSHGFNLHPVQKEIIDYNTSLGDIKRMQISISQSQFLHLIIKISNIKKVLEIGTFTGLSTLSMALALSDDGKIIALDKNEETNKVAIDFFKKANQEHKIKTLIKPALESLDEIDDILDDKAKFIDQDHSKASYAKKIKKIEGEINWNDEAQKIIGKINGLFPVPGAFFNFKGERYKILKAEIGNGLGQAGEVLSDKLEIACTNNQSIKILEIQRQGKKPQKISEFMLGSNIRKGSLLSNA